MGTKRGLFRGEMERLRTEKHPQGKQRDETQALKIHVKIQRDALTEPARRDPLSTPWTRKELVFWGLG